MNNFLSSFRWILTARFIMINQFCVASCACSRSGDRTRKKYLVDLANLKIMLLYICLHLGEVFSFFLFFSVVSALASSLLFKRFSSFNR